jgi:hypothetical protein
MYDIARSKQVEHNLFGTKPVSVAITNTHDSAILVPPQHLHLDPFPDGLEKTFSEPV